MMKKMMRVWKDRFMIKTAISQINKERLISVPAIGFGGMAGYEGLLNFMNKRKLPRRVARYLYIPTAAASLGLGIVGSVKPKWLVTKGSGMNKKAFLEETYNSAFNDELEKIALRPKTLASAARKAAIKGNRYEMEMARNKYVSNYKPLEQLKLDKKRINSSLGYNKVNMFKDIPSKERLKDITRYQFSKLKISKEEMNKMKKKMGDYWV